MENLIKEKSPRMILEYFPQAYIELQRELNTGLHKDIVDIISRYPADEIDIKLAQIASYCEVLLDGDYTLADRIKLCEILVEKLKQKRERPDGILIVN